MLSFYLERIFFTFLAISTTVNSFCSTYSDKSFFSPRFALGVVTHKVEQFETVQKVKSNPSCAEHFLRECIREKKWEEAGLIVNSLNTSMLSGSRNVVYVIAETCRRTNSLPAIIPLLKAIKVSDNICTEDDIMPLLSDSAKRGDMRAIQKIMTYLESRQVRFDVKAYSKLIKGYGIQKNEQMIDFTVSRLLKAGVAPDAGLLNSIMDAYIRCGSRAKALKVFDTITHNDGIVSSATSSSIKATTLSFHTAQLTPDVNTYNILLKALRGDRKEDLNRCWQVLDSMARNNMSPDTITINTLTDACVRAGNLTAAEQLLRHPKVSVGIEAYTSVIGGYADRGQIDECVRVLGLMKERNIAPNSYTLTSLMNAFINAGDVSRAKLLLNEKIDKSNLAALYNAYVSALSVRGDADDMKAATQAMQALQSLGIQPRIAVLNSFLHGLCKCNPPRIQEALVYVRQMLNNGPVPDSYTYSILFTVLGKEGLVEDAVQLYKAAKSLNDAAALDTAAMNSLFRAFVSGPTPMRAVEVYEELVAHDYKEGNVEAFVPDKATFTILFLAVAKAINPARFAASNTHSNDAEYIDGFYTEDRNVAILKERVGNDSSHVSPYTGNTSISTLVLDPASFRLYESSGAPKQSSGSGIGTVAGEGDVGGSELPKGLRPTEPSRATPALSPKAVNVLLCKLYRDMRFEYNIDVDSRSITVLNKLFAVTHTAGDYTLPQSEWLRRQSMRRDCMSFSSETARLIFEDLVPLGWSPKQMPAILYSCDYSDMKTAKLMQLVGDGSVQPTSASYRIFKKYGWNNFDSSWTALF